MFLSLGSKLVKLKVNKIKPYKNKKIDNNIVFGAAACKGHYWELSRLS
jgi:hypothetical protein